MTPDFFQDLPPSSPPPTLEERIAADIRKRFAPILTHDDAGSVPRWIALRPEPEIDDVYPTDDIGDIMARSCRLYDDANLIGYGATEAEAVVDLARRRHWITHSKNFFIV